MSRRTDMMRLMAHRQEKEVQEGVNLSDVSMFSRRIDLSQLTNSSYTFSCFIDFDGTESPAGSTYNIFGTDSSSAGVIFYRYYTGRLACQFKFREGNTITERLTITGMIEHGKHLFTMVCDWENKKVHLYQDTTLLSTQNISATESIFATETFKIGENISGSSSYANYKGLIFNYALSADEVAATYNNGKPQEYVLPRVMKTATNKCIAEYLPQNIDLKHSVWLDSAKQLPINDEYLPPLREGAGGCDLAANGSPEIIYKN